MRKLIMAVFAMFMIAFNALAFSASTNSFAVSFGAEVQSAEMVNLDVLAPAADSAAHRPYTVSLPAVATLNTIESKAVDFGSRIARRAVDRYDKISA